MSQPRGEALDERDMALWRFITDYIDGHGYAPTYHQMTDAVEGLYLCGTSEQLDRLARAKVIQRLKSKSNIRAIKLLKRPPTQLHNVFEFQPNCPPKLWTPDPMLREDARKFIGSRLKPYFDAPVMLYEDGNSVTVRGPGGEIVTRFEIRQASRKLVME